MTTPQRLSVSLVSLAFVTQTIHLRAERPVGFKEAPAREVVATQFTDGELDDLIATLDELLAGQADPGQWESDAANYLWTFVERLQAGRLTPDQEARVGAHF